MGSFLLKFAKILYPYMRRVQGDTLPYKKDEVYYDDYNITYRHRYNLWLHSYVRYRSVRYHYNDENNHQEDNGRRTRGSAYIRRNQEYRACVP